VFLFSLTLLAGVAAQQFQLFSGVDSQFYFRLLAANNEIVTKRKKKREKKEAKIHFFEQKINFFLSSL
jgi:hypothetical protein